MCNFLKVPIVCKRELAGTSAVCGGTRKQGGRGGWEPCEATSSKPGKRLDKRGGEGGAIREGGHHTSRNQEMWRNKLGEFICLLVVKWTL